MIKSKGEGFNICYAGKGDDLKKLTSKILKIIHEVIQKLIRQLVDMNCTRFHDKIWNMLISS